MAALDGKITIESGLRPCIVYLHEISYKSWDNEKQKMKHVTKRKDSKSFIPLLASGHGKRHCRVRGRHNP